MNDKPWPKNSPSGYTGLTTVTEGLKRSINTIAVQTLQAVGIPESYAFATEKLNLHLVPVRISQPNQSEISGTRAGTHQQTYLRTEASHHADILEAGKLLVVLKVDVDGEPSGMLLKMCFTA